MKKLFSVLCIWWQRNQIVTTFVIECWKQEMQKRDKISNELFIYYSTNLLLSHTQYLMISFYKSHAYVQMNKSSKAITLNEFFSSSFLFIIFSFSSLTNFTYLCIRSPNSGCSPEKKKLPLLSFPSFSHHQAEWNDSNLNGIVYDVLNVLAYGVI